MLLLPALLLPACIQDDGSRFNPLERFAPDIDEHAERELGWEFDRALQESVALIHDPVVTGFLNDLGQSIVSELGPQPFVYRFRVVEDPRLNAFAVPGGFVYFHTGTILAAATIDELAGVMGHEIAHVKAHHYARMREERAIPDLATQIIGMGAAIAAREPALLMIAQGINVSMQLRYGREAEAEADELGAIWMSRAGYRPDGIVRFFERILAEKERYPAEIPPYLYSHPAVEDRIQAVQIRAGDLEPRKWRDPAWNERLGDVQARLAMLLETRRETFPVLVVPADTRLTDPLLAEANERAARGEVDAALFALARAEALEPNDARVSYRIGELLQESGRPGEAAEALRRTLQLDPSRALVWFKLGEAYKANDESLRAVFAFEQAGRRASESSGMKRRAQWEIEKLSFPILVESGFNDGTPPAGGAPPGGAAPAPGDRHVGWWARLGPHFARHADRMRVRWIDPQGARVAEEPLAVYAGPWVGSTLERPGGLVPGSYGVELLLEDDLVVRDGAALGAEPESRR
jgi:predicted Zn-dependent protease